MKYKKNYLKGAISTVLALILICLAALTELPIGAASDRLEYVFNSPESVSSIIPSGHSLTYAYENNALCLTMTGGTDPIFMTRITDISMDEYKYMKIKFFSQTEDTTFQIFFDAKDSPGHSGEKSVTFTFDSYFWNEKIVNLSKNSFWKGILNILRMDPVGGAKAGEKMYIEYIAFFKTEEDAKAYGGLTAEQEKINEERKKEILKEQTSFYEGDTFAIRFNNYKIFRLNGVNATYGCSVMLYDKAALFRIWLSPAILSIHLEEVSYIDANVYKYMKIKYYANTSSKSSMMYFATTDDGTVSGSRSIAFRRGDNRKWQEQIVDINQSGVSWAGKVNFIRFDLTTSYAQNQDEYIFIEYLAFFKTLEEAQAFGGLTEEQQAGTDAISKYGEGIRGTKYASLTYPAQTKKSAETTGTENEADTGTGPAPTQKSVSPIVYVIVAMALVVVFGAVAFFGIKSRAKHGERNGVDEKE